MKWFETMGWPCIAAGLGSAIWAFGGCGGNGGSGGSVGSGGQEATSSSAASSGATTASSSSGSGGAGTGGTGAGGGAGCLDPSTFASLFALGDKAFCAVAIYTADEAIGYQVPTWGTHGGPLTFQEDASGGGVTIERWQVPQGSMGSLVKQATHVDTMIPSGAFAGAQAVDLPFFGWTAVSWTGMAPSTQGQIEMIATGAVAATYTVNGVFGIGAVAGGSGSGRVLTTGLSPIGSPMTDTNGFYAADACDMPKPDLGAGQGCSAPALIAAWGDASGPLALDHDGNAFVVLTSASMGTQEGRGFAAAEVAKGAAPAMGTSLFTIPGFGSSLAAVTPDQGAPGLMIFQPYDPKSFAPLDVIEQAYTVSGSVMAMGAPKPMLTIPMGAMNGLYFMTDDQDRLWVSQSGTSTTTFVVLERLP
jgi:hypothetical protein